MAGIKLKLSLRKKKKLKSSLLLAIFGKVWGTNFFDGHIRSRRLSDSQIRNFNLNHLNFLLNFKTFVLKPRGYFKNILLSNKGAEKSI